MSTPAPLHGSPGPLHAAPLRSDPIPGCEYASLVRYERPNGALLSCVLVDPRGRGQDFRLCLKTKGVLDDELVEATRRHSFLPLCIGGRFWMSINAGAGYYSSPNVLPMAQRSNPWAYESFEVGVGTVCVSPTGERLWQWAGRSILQDVVRKHGRAAYQAIAKSWRPTLLEPPSARAASEISIGVFMEPPLVQAIFDALCQETRIALPHAEGGLIGFDDFDDEERADPS